MLDKYNYTNRRKAVEELCFGYNNFDKFIQWPTQIGVD